VPSVFYKILSKVMGNADTSSRINMNRGNLFRNTRRRDGVERDGRDGRDYDDTRAYGKIFSEIPGTNPHLRLEAIVEGLTRKRKFAHCVGRAIQLLDSAPVFTGQVGTRRVSYVCDPKFSKDSISGSAGVTLSSATGIIALANLFYDSIHPNMLTITVEEKESLKAYIDFMRKITRTFTAKSISEADPPETMLRSLSQSETTPRDKDICGGKFGQPIVIEGTTDTDKEFQRKVYSVVQALFRYQIVHASKCAEIFLQLFEMSRVKGQYTMRIHPNIMKKGMAEINRISVLARATLVEYYERCEGMYLQGMKLVVKGPPSAVDAVLDATKQAAITGVGVKLPTGQQAVIGQAPRIATEREQKQRDAIQRKQKQRTDEGQDQGLIPRRVQFANDVITPATRE
jgi:hypothetical protein